MMEYGSKREIVARMKSHKGKPKPQTGFGFPQHLRERERKREKRCRRTSQQQRRRKRGLPTPKRTMGSGPEGRQTKQHSNPRDDNPQTNAQQQFQITLTKNQLQNQQSLGALVTAGWRGPWAALHSWGVTPGDRSTEGYKYPPTTGTAPGGAKSGQLTRHKSITPKVVSQHLAVLRLPRQDHK